MSPIVKLTMADILPFAAAPDLQSMFDAIMASPPVVQGMPFKPYHTKGKDDWGTPQLLFDRLHSEFQFTVDMAADEDTAKCADWVGESVNALTIDWWGRVFLNPPFTKTDEFINKLALEMAKGTFELAVALVADRSDTSWMFQASCHAGEIRHLKGRLSYELYPTDWQRAACEALKSTQLDQDIWPNIIKLLNLPKTAILQLREDPNTPGGDSSLSINAPFPSQVLIFDRRKTQRTVYWNWKEKLKTVYAYSPTGSVLQAKLVSAVGSMDAPSLIAPGWTEAQNADGSLTVVAPLTIPKGLGMFTGPPLTANDLPGTAEEFIEGTEADGTADQAADEHSQFDGIG